LRVRVRRRRPLAASAAVDAEDLAVERERFVFVPVAANGKIAGSRLRLFLATARN